MNTGTFFSRHTALILLLGLTVLYLLQNIGMDTWLPSNPLAAFMGLFVPAGIWNSLGSFGIVPLVSIIVAVCLDRYLNRRELSQVRKIVITLVVLATLTLVADLVIWRTWSSMALFLGFFGIRIPITSGF